MDKALDYVKDIWTNKIILTVNKTLDCFGAIWDSKIVIVIVKMLLSRLIRSKTSGITLEIAVMLMDSIIVSKSNNIIDIEPKFKAKDE